MPNPEILLCDADALIQVFISRQVQLLLHLKQTYGVKPGVVPEVETEVSFHRKFKTRFEVALRGQIDRGNISVLDRSEMRRLFGRAKTAAQVDEDLRHLAARGQRYGQRVGAGEAHSHAAGVDLRLPFMSHDWRAVETLQAAGEAVAVPVVRLWDLFALAFDDGVVSEANGEQAIEHLEHEGEFIPRPLAGGKFRDAIRAFASRLRRAPPGATPGGPRDPRDPLYLHPLG